MMAEWDADRIKGEADFKMMAKMNADQEESNLFPDIHHIYNPFFSAR
jgi:hypothetical protein